MRRKPLSLSEDQWCLSKGPDFISMVNKITQIGLEYHKETILENSKQNVIHIQGRTIRALLGRGRPNALVVSAGPSLYRNGTLRRIKDSNFRGDIIAIDGSYIQCLKAGIVPDYVITLDPHPTRVVRWFGDPDYEKHRQEDDYFERQDLDVLFRQAGIEQNQENIRIVDGSPCKLVISTTSPANVVERTSKMERFWFAPLVDDPAQEGITRTIVKETGAPALNTGGTVGTTASIFARTILGCSNVAVVGMDLGYYPDTPLEKTQSYHMVNGNPEMYHWEETPYGRFYTDLTYFWYRQNLLDLLEANNVTITNCTGAGMLYGKNVINMELEDWLRSSL
jgi:6-hydroxymethylpterin diphosphokinase MptE-like protein